MQIRYANQTFYVFLYSVLHRTLGENLSTVSVLKLGGLYYRPSLDGAGSGVILILGGFVFFVTKRFMLNLTLLLVLMSFFSPVQPMMIVVTRELVYLSRLVTKPSKWVCTQRKLRSDWASASLLRVFAVRMKKAWVLSYPWCLNALIRFLSNKVGWRFSHSCRNFG